MTARDRPHPELRLLRRVPDQTDDDVLYLDTSRLITFPPDATLFVSLVGENGASACTIIREDETRILARQFGLKLACQGY